MHLLQAPAHRHVLHAHSNVEAAPSAGSEAEADEMVLSLSVVSSINEVWFQSLQTELNVIHSIDNDGCCTTLPLVNSKH